MSTFEELTSSRRLLKDFCSLHFASVLHFHSGQSFKRDASEGDLGSDVRHITTSVTCLQSLVDCPEVFRPIGSRDVSILCREFAEKAIELPLDKWTSEGNSALVYCKCRGLPFVAGQLLSYHAMLKEHVLFILDQMERKGSSRFGIGEARPDTDPSDWYPPNAFHTYWALRLLDTVEKFEDDERRTLWEERSIDRRRKEMLLWSKHILGYQIALHSIGSSDLDSDQLAWSLATVLTSKDTSVTSLAEQDFIREAFKCLFGTQLPVGTWMHYQPLFHYEKVGNAYSFVFETFAVLLSIALMNDMKGDFLRRALRPYCGNLLKLWKYARTTHIQLHGDDRTIGWCSGHRANQKQPEGWVTASVFSFSQALRRLVGIWSREEALAGLNSVPGQKSRADARRVLIERSDTWPSSGGNLAEQLITLFVNTVELGGLDERLEPDRQIIAEDQARAAILFGPPGTSKTTIARSVAEVIGWNYLEVHATHFVAEGLPNVQRTADELFRKLMELDHAVVLFDEIDELVREREVEHDAFGQFLTTSMLPKLAELWKQRKIMYFVETNHIEYFDRAITRSQRFDALLLVGPPSFKSKTLRLQDLIKEHYGKEIQIVCSTNQIEVALQKVLSLKAGGVDELSVDTSLAKFMLLRWDQLDELAIHIARILAGVEVTAEILARALLEISDVSLKKVETYRVYLKNSQYTAQDCGKIQAWEVRGIPPGVDPPTTIKQAQGKHWLIRKANSTSADYLASLRLKSIEPGVLSSLGPH